MEQDDIIRRLSQGEGFGGVLPDRIDTHISTIFLVGDDAYKLKHALKTSYLDYASLAARKRFCRAELEVNRRTAPQLYLDLIPVRVAADDTLVLGDGPGPPVEWLVHMRRFAQEDLFDNLAAENSLSSSLLIDLADEIAAFHESAEIVERPEAASRLMDVIEQNARELRNKPEGLVPPDLVDRFDKTCRTALAGVREKLDRRGTEGRVRRCHGDLHLRNICLVDHRPTLFDAIEFSDSIPNIDVLFDLSFLIMDLKHRGMDDAANLVFNRYLYRTGDIGDLAIFPLFLAVRAGIRAHVSAMDAATREDPADKSRLQQDAQSYLELGLRLLQPTPPVLVAVGGLSGSGKSTVARLIAAHLGVPPGALVFSSDLIRKKMAGVEPLTRLTGSAYGPEQNERVYKTLFDSARAALSSGYSVVIDATFVDRAGRQKPAEIAKQSGVAFTGFWLDTDTGVLRQRLSERKGDPSDATLHVLDQQSEKDVGSISWVRIDAGRTPDLMKSDILAILRSPDGQGNGS